MQAPVPEFRPEEMKALLPWREYHLQPIHIALGTIAAEAVVAAVWYFDGKGDVLYYWAAAGLVAVVFPAVLILMSWGPSPVPIAMDSQGIVAPTLWGKAYVPWAKVRAIAHVHSIWGWSRAPIEFNLIVFFKRGVPMRLSLPELSGDERQQLFDVLSGIARLHDIKFVADHTQEGRSALRRLPWFWI